MSKRVLRNPLGLIKKFGFIQSCWKKTNILKELGIFLSVEVIVRKRFLSSQAIIGAEFWSRNNARSKTDKKVQDCRSIIEDTGVWIARKGIAKGHALAFGILLTSSLTFIGIG
jgi:hypothetical protein